ncbi:hypothetical protein PghCCS26_35530 [Paenibacillus glycanilyticus]|uniref:Uncharacterized protein n=1 Tax=Paenibacillus glycanilyticus TaxID=126569 RepID=A0ABQ6NQY5_9BACL|nr:hypothetical protein PghCCS26_35530 [Paenibacillus glycanilyticus]
MYIYTKPPKRVQPACEDQPSLVQVSTYRKATSEIVSVFTIDQASLSSEDRLEIGTPTDLIDQNRQVLLIYCDMASERFTAFGQGRH